MKKLLVTISLVFLFFVFGYGEEFIKHNIEVVKLIPEHSYIEVIDTISFPGKYKNKRMHFLLNKNLKILDESNMKIEKGKLKSEFFGINTSEFKIDDRVGVKHYSFFLKNKSFTIKYKGKILPEFKKSEEYQRGFSESFGVISKKGVYLAGATFWVPWFNDELVTFRINYNLANGWDAVSQGKYIESNGKRAWDCVYPMDEVYFIAAKFYKFKKRYDNVDVLAYLRSNDKNLSTKYLETTGQYLKMYDKLIAPYPYSKFALIENFWETGYGMPSFTLLGPKVIRFPFILHSSYPHELLHNWWGNSVFVDYEKGNWCEGITVYMADHLIKEQQRLGYIYRRDTLKAYTDHVNKKNEFALKDFRARYNASSSAIGYGKSMMMFHMLRVMFGDELFKKSMKDFYLNNKFKKVSFNEIRKSFEKTTDKKLNWFFSQWVNLKGAPQLFLEDVKLIEKKDKYIVDFKIKQKGNFIYKLYIPLFIYFKNKTTPDIKFVNLNKDEEGFRFEFQLEPLRISVDENFDVFRRLDSIEVPATLSNLFGEDEIIIILPSKVKQNIKSMYNDLINKLKRMRKQNIIVKYDYEIKNLNENKSYWIFSNKNKLIRNLKNYIDNESMIFNDNKLKINEKILSLDRNSVLWVEKNKDNNNSFIGFLSITKNEMADSLLRKIFHYGKYSYLSFVGKDSVNNLKGIWKVKNSPLVYLFYKNGNYKFKRFLRKPLAAPESTFNEQDFKKHIKFLASEKLKGRGLGTKELDIASEYIRDRFREYGLRPAGDKGYFQEFNRKFNKKGVLKIRNIIGYVEGNNKEYEDQSIVVCAHYDHLGLGWPDVRKGNEGKIHFGADDNASGISVMLELAKYFSKSFNPERRIIFVAFSAEEAGLLGSKYFVENFKKFNVKKIIGIINLDTVGRLKNKNPMILGSTSAKEWKFIFMGIGFTTGIKTDIVLQDIDSSDQKSFINAGIPAIQIFSGPHLDYHRPTDTIDKIDFKGMIRIATIAKEAIIYLSSRKKPLTFTGNTDKVENSEQKKQIKSQGKSASLGIMPDFSFNGKGVKIGMVIKGGAADKYGLKKGDIIVRIANSMINNLKEYAMKLRTLKPEQKATVVIIRNNREKKYEIILQYR